MTEVHILDLIDVKEQADDKYQFILTFTGNRVFVVNKLVAEGIVTWMLANEDQGGYYPMVFGDFKLTAGRPYKHHHTKHRERLRNKRYYFREWFACEAELKRTKTLQSGIAISMPGSNVRVIRHSTPGWDRGPHDWYLEYRMFSPVSEFSKPTAAL